LGAGAATIAVAVIARSQRLHSTTCRRQPAQRNKRALRLGVQRAHIGDSRR
jgi:hypothetical protein